jgi:hypothetical protein
MICVHIDVISRSTSGSLYRNSHSYIHHCYSAELFHLDSSLSFSGNKLVANSPKKKKRRRKTAGKENRNQGEKQQQEKDELGGAAGAAGRLNVLVVQNVSSIQ